MNQNALMKLHCAIEIILFFCVEMKIIIYIIHLDLLYIILQNRIYYLK